MRLGKRQQAEPEQMLQGVASRQHDGPLNNTDTLRRKQGIVTAG